MGKPRPGGEVIKVKNPRTPDKLVRVGRVLEWTSYGSPMCIMDDNGEQRAFPADWVTVIQEAPSEPVEEEKAEPCPHTSNGQPCRYYANHDGQHTYGGGLGDPVSNKHCEEPELHVSHAWTDEKVWFNCSGRALEESTGVGDEEGEGASL